MAVRHLKWYASWVQNVVRQLDIKRAVYKFGYMLENLIGIPRYSHVVCSFGRLHEVTMRWVQAISREGQMIQV